MNNRALLLGGAAIVAIGAAFAAGQWYSHPTPLPPAPVSTQINPAPEPAGPVQEAPAPQPSQTVTERPAPAPVKPKPPKRVADYSSGEDQYAAPPPPPPPPLPREEFRDHPNPFIGRFNMFPMRHSGAGTIASPLTWSAQTALGNDREADLRISILVPEPPPNDRGQFWREWGGRNQIDLIPELTRGTPVIVAGSASVVVTVDPEILDLDAPATLLISGRDGQRVYRSRDVAPARGEAWDSRGARWIFVPDADFYRMLRDGADVSIAVRSRLDGREIRIPFNTDDFPHTAREFERDLSRRIDAIAASWDRARPGRPMPPPPVVAPPPNPPPYPQPGNGYPYPPGSDHGHDHGRDHSGNGAPPPNANPTPVPNPPATQPTNPPNDNSGHGHGRDHGMPPSTPATASNPLVTPPANPANPSNDNTGHDHGKPKGEKPTVTPPAAGQPATPAKPPTPPPAKPAKPVSANPAPTVDPRAAAREAMVTAYRPPTDNCGPEPAFSPGATVTPADRAAFGQKRKWMVCRTQWINEYEKSIDALGKRVADPGVPAPTALERVKGGPAVEKTYQQARAEFTAQSNAWLPQINIYLKANGTMKGGKQP